jgi:hypothetical protein
MRAAATCVIVLLGVCLPVPSRAATEQVIGSRDLGADVAVDGAGRAFLVSLSTGNDPGTFASVPTRRAAPDAGFGRARILLRSSRTDRAVDAGVAADGSGVIVVQSIRGADRRVRVVTFGARGAVSAPVTVSAPGDRADFAAAAFAPSGAGVILWFRHRTDRRWRLEAAIREPGGAAFGPAQPVSRFVRRACCSAVSVAIGARGDAVAAWTSTSRSGVWAALRSPGRGFRRPQRVARKADDLPRAYVGSGGMAALIYSVQHVPRRAGDGLALHRAARGHAFGAAAHVNPGGGVTVGDAAVTPSGRVMLAWIDQVHGARVHLSEAAPAQPPVETTALGTSVTPEAVAVAADDDGRAVVAWSELASAEPAYRERPVAATRPAVGAAFGPTVALGGPWRAAAPVLARLVPGGGALVVWHGARYGGRTDRRAALAVARVP